MSGLEAKIEEKVCYRALTELGVPNVKWGTSGWPDRIFLIPGGKPLFIEFKAPGGKLDPRQEFRIECLKLWGYQVEVHDDEHRAFHAIAEALASSSVHEKGSKVSSGTRSRGTVPRSGPG